MGGAVSQPAPTKRAKIELPQSELSEQEKKVTWKDKTPSAQASNGGQSHRHHGAKSNVKVQSSQVPGMESNKAGANTEDKFTDYINRTKNIIRTPSSVDGNIEKHSSAPAESKSRDQFSDYISRARKKMLRTITGFIGGRSDSMK